MEDEELVRDRFVGFGNVVVILVFDGVPIGFFRFKHLVVETPVGQVVVGQLTIVVVGMVIVDEP